MMLDEKERERVSSKLHHLNRSAKIMTGKRSSPDFLSQFMQSDLLKQEEMVARLKINFSKSPGLGAEFNKDQ